jgi:hypothetical protein
MLEESASTSLQSNANADAKKQLPKAPEKKMSRGGCAIIFYF